MAKKERIPKDDWRKHLIIHARFRHVEIPSRPFKLPESVKLQVDVLGTDIHQDAWSLATNARLSFPTPPCRKPLKALFSAQQPVVSWPTARSSRKTQKEVKNAPSRSASCPADLESQNSSSLGKDIFRLDKQELWKTSMGSLVCSPPDLNNRTGTGEGALSRDVFLTKCSPRAEHYVLHLLGKVETLVCHRPKSKPWIREDKRQKAEQVNKIVDSLCKRSSIDASKPAESKHGELTLQLNCPPALNTSLGWNENGTNKVKEGVPACARDEFQQSDPTLPIMEPDPDAAGSDDCTTMDQSAVNQTSSRSIFSPLGCSDGNAESEDEITKALRNADEPLVLESQENPDLTSLCLPTAWLPEFGERLAAPADPLGECQLNKMSEHPADALDLETTFDLDMENDNCLGVERSQLEVDPAGVLVDKALQEDTVLSLKSLSPAPPDPEVNAALAGIADPLEDPLYLAATGEADGRPHSSASNNSEKSSTPERKTEDVTSRQLLKSYRHKKKPALETEEHDKPAADEKQLVEDKLEESSVLELIVIPEGQASPSIQVTAVKSPKRAHESDSENNKIAEKPCKRVAPQKRQDAAPARTQNCVDGPQAVNSPNTTRAASPSAREQTTFTGLVEPGKQGDSDHQATVIFTSMDVMNRDNVRSEIKQAEALGMPQTAITAKALALLIHQLISMNCGFGKWEFSVLIQFLWDFHESLGCQPRDIDGKALPSKPLRHAQLYISETEGCQVTFDNKSKPHGHQNMFEEFSSVTLARFSEASHRISELEKWGIPNWLCQMVLKIITAYYFCVNGDSKYKGKCGQRTFIQNIPSGRRSHPIGASAQKESQPVDILKQALSETLGALSPWVNRAEENNDFEGTGINSYMPTLSSEAPPMASHQQETRDLPLAEQITISDSESGEDTVDSTSNHHGMLDLLSLKICILYPYSLFNKQCCT
jgi:hypothetical protein